MAGTESDVARAYRVTSMPSASTAWRTAEFTVIDLETTGLDPSSDEIISLGAVTVSGGRIVVGDSRYALIRPKRMPDGDTIRIHGLRETELNEARPLSEQLDSLLEVLTGRVLVAHVAAIERGFLGAALRDQGLELDNPIVDTSALDQELRRLRGRRGSGRDPVGLSELARSLGLPVHRPHHAYGDALTTAQVFLALATHLDALERQTVGTLVRAGGGGPRLLERIKSRLRL